MSNFSKRYNQVLGLLQGRFGQGVIWNIDSLAILAVGGMLMNLIVIRFQGREALGVFN